VNRLVEPPSTRRRWYEITQIVKVRLAAEPGGESVFEQRGIRQVAIKVRVRKEAWIMIPPAMRKKCPLVKKKQV